MPNNEVLDFAYLLAFIPEETPAGIDLRLTRHLCRITG